MTVPNALFCTSSQEIKPTTLRLFRVWYSKQTCLHLDWHMLMELVLEKGRWCFIQKIRTYFQWILCLHFKNYLMCWNRIRDICKYRAPFWIGARSTHADSRGTRLTWNSVFQDNFHQLHIGTNAVPQWNWREILSCWYCTVQFGMFHQHSLVTSTCVLSDTSWDLFTVY
jgi:hypothetical protein